MSVRVRVRVRDRAGGGFGDGLDRVHDGRPRALVARREGVQEHLVRVGLMVGLGFGPGLGLGFGFGLGVQEHHERGEAET